MMEWLPTPLRPTRNTADARRWKQERQSKTKGSVAKSPVCSSLVFHSSEDLCVCAPYGATLASQVLLGLGDGRAPQGSTGGSDDEFSTKLSSELLSASQKIAEVQLLQSAGKPDGVKTAQQEYGGPISLLKEAYKATRSPGSTTVALAALDNSTVIHGQAHPMVAMLSLGGCELLQLRRRAACKSQGERSKNSQEVVADSPAEQAPAKQAEHSEESMSSPQPLSDLVVEKTCNQKSEESSKTFSRVNAGELEVIFRVPPKKQCMKEQASQCMDAKDANVSECHALLCRDIMDTDLETARSLQAIEANSIVHCASARQGDIILLISTGLLVDSALDKCAAICNETLPPTKDTSPIPPGILRRLAHRIAREVVSSCQNSVPEDVHSASGDFLPTDDLPIQGSVVVAEVVESVTGDSEGTSSDGATPEKIDGKARRICSRSGDRNTTASVLPRLEGLEAAKTVHCSMTYGDYGVLVTLDLPKLEMPRRPLRRTITNDFICDFD